MQTELGAPASPQRLRVIVTRGSKYDVAEWMPDDGSGPASTPPPAPQGGWLNGPRAFALVGSMVVVVGTLLLVKNYKPGLAQPLVPTVADLSAVHAGVTAAGEDVRRVRRLRVGDAVETDADGRARLRLDDGTVLIVDRATKLVLTAEGIDLAHGRVFVQGAVGARTRIAVGGATGIVSGAHAGVERGKDGKAKLYAASGELTVRAGTSEKTVRTGETATVHGTEANVAPERAFDDWTGGMAAPWAAKGSPRRAVGELWGRLANAQPGDAGSPLTIRAHDVRATITNEVAQTEVSTTYFNAGSEAVVGDFRMAVPPGAIVSRFAVGPADAPRAGQVALASRTNSTYRPAEALLEWAGDGWLRGSLPAIPSGGTVTVVVGWVEWLTPASKPGSKNLVVQYRYPMSGSATPPLIGEFSARVDAAPSSPASMASGLGGRATGQAVEIRRPDFRPTADLVVDVEIEPFTSPARAYVAPAGEGDEAGATVVVRTEAPTAAREDGVTLALVVDTSASVEPSLLDAERALVEAVLAGLGARDRAVVIAADQIVGAVGPAAIGPVDDARRKAVGEALARLAPGGATDLGRALEAAADALPGDAPAAMVVYVGDGWPTIGDGSVDAIHARLARRPGGAPRLGAVAVGPLANRYMLAALVSGSGPLLEIADTSDAAQTAVTLVSEALAPTVAGVELAFGPEVERVYPRTARAALAGETVTSVGRVRGDLPKEVTLRWRDASGPKEKRLPIVVEKTVDFPDVERRWAAARVEEVVLSGKGREAATDVALRAGLLTPWTGLVVSSVAAYVPTPLATRILDLSTGAEASFASVFATPRGGRGALADVPRDVEDEGEDSEEAFKAAVASAAEQVIEQAGPPIRACRDSRAALRPELGGALDVSVEIDGGGRAKEASVRGTTPSADDAALNRCVEVVLSGLAYPQSGLTVTVTVKRLVDLPPPRSTLRGRKCSPTSTLPLPLRRGVWRERLSRDAAWTVYLDAKGSCELPTWTDRRTLLELVLGHVEDGLSRVDVARNLDRAGETDAATLLRREAVRRARSPEELRAIQVALVGDEHYPLGTFKKKYKAENDDEGRLGVVRRFLGIAPHDARLKRRLVALLESLGKKQELADEVRRIRLDPFADAGLLADAAAALRRAGDENESRRTFGELTERAPHDPWARAFLGDRLRNEGWFDDATLAYTVLEQLVPDDPAAIVRLALAHAGAGRLDIAHRMLTRVAQTGGRAGDAQLGELAGRLAGVLLAQARGREGLPAEDADRLARFAVELPHPVGATSIVVHAPAGWLALDATLARGPKEAREERKPEIAAEGIGLYAMRLDPGDGGDAVLKLSRREELAPAAATKVRVDALVPEGLGKPPRLETIEVELPISGKAVALRWDSQKWARE